jgi:GNAT superfamily N-acetyltransferase
MVDVGVAGYRSAFARRSAAMATAGQTIVDEPGMCGVLGSVGFPTGRLLITDDRAARKLEALMVDPPVRIVNVLADAARCRELVERTGWAGEEAIAMICSDLAVIPVLPVPERLTIRPVRRAATDPINGVPLRQAAEACLKADPHTAGHPLPGFVGFLQSLPVSTRLLAAVDDQHCVCGTAGSSALGLDANAYFVSTDESWRRQGLATAMTAVALTWAREAGARQASLDASPAGLSIYLRLGFQAVSPARLFARFG